MMEDREFAEIVKNTKGVVLSAIERHLAVRFYHSIDDVVQEVYIRAYRGLRRNSFRGDSSLETWLYRIAKNESLRMTGRLKREEEKFKKAAIRQMGITKDYASESGELTAMEIDLKKMIKRLPEKYKSVLELVALGFSEKQISEKLAIKIGTVKSRAYRGRELIQRVANGGVKR
ncbi:MAG: sigma-70 family RNA polymerase sigma factor [Spirochaetota bacterium]|nr:sigma-70 family RNA polymerase sigma factor [Spirochaetota bacterium]